jgi:hypothetical protein
MTIGMKDNTRVYTCKALYSELYRLCIACNISNHLEIHFQSITLKTVLKSILNTFENVVKNFICRKGIDFYGLSYNIDATRRKL